ncbi:next to BRCA1 gene 1 protein isoform X2 [Eublepharis macularius]|uniref:Next to BRCA1 gene 1 protein n=1 Tax=Eublepharis macularius TaxID=481883 RepID=A0AA97K4V2_EUBMA|nr:next to BRCA1 gene 1 protein isoform X2 [Eublepharis macularius]
MDPQVNLSVTFQRDTQSFLVSDSSNTTWADVEAMVKVSFDLNDIQIKYLDEDHDEVSVNSAEEYEEALKIAAKQGHWLQMNVYELSGPRGTSSWQVPEKSEICPVPEDGRKPLSQYSMLAQTEGPDSDVEEEAEKTQSEHHLSQGPPEWFTSYLEKFREQVVQETVETLEQKLSEKLLLSSQIPSSLSSSAQQSPVSPLVQGNPFDWLLSCSNCQASIVGIRYQCSVCPSYSICELCEAGIYAHDPNHLLLKLRRPVLCLSETYNLWQSSPRLATLEQLRLQKQVDKRFLKAEKQRLRAEKKQRKAEVRELKKQLKLHRKIHLWNSVHALDSIGLTAARSESLQPNTLRPLQACPVIVPTLSAAFVDENLPDGTHLRPRTAFIKHWRMRNIGNMEWNSDTKLKFMWGNLTLVSSEKKDVTVPSLQPGQVGIVSVAFVAPSVEGTYTSHWRLSHRGEQFGPRIWCSIVVDSSCMDCLESGKQMCNFGPKGRAPYKKEERSTETKAEALEAADTAIQGGLTGPSATPQVKSIPCDREFYIPSVDLLTAQDLLSFELLDINIVQELEQVSRNNPVDSQEGKGKSEYPANQEEGDEDMSGTQFVCETVIRSLTLDAAPDHKPPQKKKSLQTSQQALHGTTHYNPKTEDPSRIKSSSTSALQDLESADQGAEMTKEPEFEKLVVPDGEEASDREADEDAQDEVRSQASSASSEDYVVILPECFDTSRPLGESMYSSALSQPSSEKGAEGPASPGEESQPSTHSINDILTTSQVLDAVPLTPQVVEPQPVRSLDLSQDDGPRETRSQEAVDQVREATSLDQVREEHLGDVSGAPPAGIVTSTSTSPEFSRHTQGNSLAGGLMKGALSVAASAYKALFAGPPSIEQALPVITEEQTTAFLANLSEMGFCDRQLNLRLLRKHNCDMAEVVTELLQQSHSDWYGNQY